MLSLRLSLCGRAHLPRRSLFILFGAFLAAGCGGPTSPHTVGPVLVCPNVALQSLDGNASPVIYDTPSVVAGESPISGPTCAPISGSIFLLGASTVTCTATDAAARQASCSFTVTVTAPPRISVTDLLAFGNSITEGKSATGVIFPPNTYPVKLSELLNARYTAQAITVANRGRGGESTAQGAERLRTLLDVLNPEVLLLEEGINDLSGGDLSKIEPMIAALRDMIRQARSRSIYVFLGTLLPVREGSPRTAAFSVLTVANERIRLLALAEDVELVDLYDGFGRSADPYIDVDGLHPTADGYAKMAQLFFDAIRATLEAPQAVSPVFVRNLPVSHLPDGRLR